MNTERIENDNKEEMLKIVNEDWPVLEELAKKKFVINKKKNKDIQESVNVLQSILDEDNKLEQNHKIQQINEKFPIEEKEIGISNIQNVKDEKIVTQEVQKKSFSQTKQVSTSLPQSDNFVYKQKTQSNEEKNVQTVMTSNVTNSNSVFIEKTIITEKSIDLLKLVIVGLTHLYISKTNDLLKPLKFILENYKVVMLAAINFIVPFIMTYFVTTHIEFVTEQLTKETIFMKLLYISIFFFGFTFLWITGQVIFSGFISMFKNSMVEVAKVGKENLKKINKI
jgi:hypothetical protein